MNKTFHLHLVSDSTGETTYSLARACLVQFENIEVNTQTHSQVLNSPKMQKVIAAIEANPGAVMYTMIDKSLGMTLVAECARIGVPCIDVLDGVISRLQGYFGQSIRGQPGRQHQLNEDYFHRIDAMQFALSHDDLGSSGTSANFGAPFTVSGPPALASIGIEINFSLTQDDQASITSVFFVTPAPGVICLLAIGALGTGRGSRRRRC